MPKTITLRTIFATNLRQSRLGLGISQEELAHRAGLHRTYVGSVERGERNVSIDNIERLSSALDMAAATLLAEASGRRRK